MSPFTQRIRYCLRSRFKQGGLGKRYMYISKRGHRTVQHISARCIYLWFLEFETNSLSLSLRSAVQYQAKTVPTDTHWWPEPQIVCQWNVGREDKAETW